jgi:hypothetical protein
MITLFPLIFEVGYWRIYELFLILLFCFLFKVKREEMFEQLEREQINRGFAEGKTPHELAMQGLTSAIEPKVL